ncbi:hypothetical protein RO3G_07566 [Lichtheimia corymbifera JMRC:FSU:9682]|uniref:CCHC-type domain-containing protein n=1 Tax=Lichtheimia corymbifera JMRC:FSU:9682 TaxID=1263082 RepID=A0A068RY35_9FUNG|nr:hypothetical protein RO3G_07566 [Lichtheimia corymbifera JMRC:FSU:9682]
MKHGLFHRAKLLVGVERTLGASFTIDGFFRSLSTMPETPSGDQPKVAQPSPNISLDPKLSWAQIAQKKRVSLVHRHFTIANAGETNQQTVIHSHVFRRGRSPGSIFFDVSSRSGTVKDILKMLTEQYNHVNGVLVHREGPRVIVEAYFNTQEEYARALSCGLEFPQQTFVRGSAGITGDAIVKKIRLTHLPFMDLEKLKAGLHSTMAMYGQVLDVGINRDETTNLFMGNGFAVLNVAPIEGEQDFLPLGHHIAWEGDENNLIYATYADMPLHCSRCHDAGHGVKDCPLRRSQMRECWNCGARGHLSYNCPRKKDWVPGDDNRSRRKTNRSQHSVVSDDVPKPTDSAVQHDRKRKSRHQVEPAATVVEQPSVLEQVDNPTATDNLDDDSSSDFEETMDTDPDVDMTDQSELEATLDQIVMAVSDGIIEETLPNNILASASTITLSKDWYRRLPLSEVCMDTIEKEKFTEHQERILAAIIYHRLDEMGKADQHAAHLFARVTRSGRIRFPSAPTEAGSQ